MRAGSAESPREGSSMFFGRRTNRRVAASARTLSRFTFCQISVGIVSLGLVISASLLTGCSETSSPSADFHVDHEPAWSRTQAEATLVAWQPTLHQDTGDQPLQPEMAAPIPLADYPYENEEDSPATLELELSTESAQEQKNTKHEEQEQLWSFPASEGVGAPREFSILVPFPPVEEVAREEMAPEEVAVEEVIVDFPAVEETVELIFQAPASPLGKQPKTSNEQPIAQLLPPQPIAVAKVESRESRHPTPTISTGDLSAGNRSPETPLSETGTPKIATELFAFVEAPPLSVLAELDEQKQLLAALSRDSSSAVTGVLTDGRVNELAKTKIQHAYAMASRGALYVARKELIEVLRMISQAKDAQQGTPKRTKSLAAGLRALREAEDFAPHGTQLEAELDITVLCASHRTPIAQQSDAANLLPSLMMDRYLRYAQLQLAMSVAGEPAGSMALHALGKLNSQLGRVEPEKNRLADRHAIAYQQAALLAHNQNYLAAHELGVLLATSGHFAESEQLLKHVAARESNAVVYRNLARVQEKLGRSNQALGSRDNARQLSQQGATGTNNVQWVSPDQFARGITTQIPRYTTAQRPATQQPAAQRPPAPPQTQLVIPGSRTNTQRR